MLRLGLDRVLALEHVVNLVEVVGARGDGRGVTLGGEVLLEMGLLAEVTVLRFVSLVALSLVLGTLPSRTPREPMLGAPQDAQGC